MNVFIVFLIFTLFVDNCGFIFEWKIICEKSRYCVPYSTLIDKCYYIRYIPLVPWLFKVRENDLSAYVGCNRWI